MFNRFKLKKGPPKPYKEKIDKKKKEKPPPPRSVGKFSLALEELKGICNWMKNNKIWHCLIVPTFWCALVFYIIIFLLLMIFGIIIVLISIISTKISIWYDNAW